VIRTASRRHIVALAVAAVIVLAGCADSGTAPALPGQADTSGYDAIIAGSAVAGGSTITPGTWADKNVSSNVSTPTEFPSTKARQPG